jgi:hypothetical protein
MPPSVEVPLVLAYQSRIQGIFPNVAVVVRPDDGTPIDRLIDGVAEETATSGGTVLSTSVDRQTNGGLLYVSRLNELTGTSIYHLQRYCIAKGHIFEISAGNVPPDTPEARTILEELRSILNSFRIIE